MSVYVVANDDYLTSGYVADSYVGTDADLYVEAGYVIGVVLGEADLSSTATVTADSTTLVPGTTNITVAITTATDGRRTRKVDSSVSSQSTVSASPSRTRQGSISISGALNLTTSPSRTRQGSTSISGALNFTTSASLERVGIADITSTFTATITGGTTRQGAAELITAGDEVQWQDGLTWGNPRSEIWGPLFDVEAQRARFGEINANANFTLTTDASLTRNAASLVASSGTMSVDGLRTRNSDATLASTVTFDPVDTTTNILANIPDLSSVFTVQPFEAIAVINGIVELSSSATVSAVGNLTQRSTVLKASSGTMSVDGLRTRNTQSSISSQASLEVEAAITQRGIVLKASAGTMTVNGLRTRNTFATSQSVVTVDSRLGIIQRPIPATQNVEATLQGTLFSLRLDPFRIYTVPTESRVVEIDAESRLYTVKSENRVNTIEEETRNYLVPSETRKYIVQPLTLVDVAETAIDRREG